LVILYFKGIICWDYSQQVIIVDESDPEEKRTDKVLTRINEEAEISEFSQGNNSFSGPPEEE
jgi:hypothetical protein